MLFPAYISNAVDPYSGQIILTPVESDPYITGNIPECYVEDALSFQTVENSAETIVENPVENPLEKPLDNPVENIDEENELVTNHSNYIYKEVVNC